MLYNLFLRIPVSYMNSLQLLSLIYYDLFMILKNKWWDQHGHGGMGNDVEIVRKRYHFFSLSLYAYSEDSAIPQASHLGP